MDRATRQIEALETDPQPGAGMLIHYLSVVGIAFAIAFRALV